MWSLARPDTHREATLARRRALVEAAVDVVAEKGVAGATHREIARRAGVPLSTTSYFFASIDELVLTALREFQAELLEQLQGLRAMLESQRLSPAAAVDVLIEVLFAEPPARIVAQFEGYLEASRRPGDRDEVAVVIDAFEQLAESMLTAAGANHPAEGARAFVALIDGFALHRLARPRPGSDGASLRRALLDLLAAQLLDDEERRLIDARLAQTPRATPAP